MKTFRIFHSLRTKPFPDSYPSQPSQKLQLLAFPFSAVPHSTPLTRCFSVPLHRSQKHTPIISLVNSLPACPVFPPSSVPLHNISRVAPTPEAGCRVTLAGPGRPGRTD
eukprot:754171-Hanusia_phi.AAC.1